MNDVRIEGNYPVDRISDISMNIKVNEHGTLTYSGLVSKEEAMRYVEQGSDRQLVRVYIKDRLEFCGYPNEISTEWPNADFDNNHCHVNIKLVTSTLFIDLYPKKRFYQDTTRTFEDVIMEALEDSQIGNLVAIRGKQSIEEPLLQYRETDWQFALRMAGRLGTFVVPNVLSEEPEFALGVPKGEVREELNDFAYHMGRNISEFRTKFNETSKFSQQIKGLQGVSDFHNFLRYRMRSENHYNLGDSVIIDGKMLVIVHKSLRYERSGIEVVYTLGHEEDFSVSFHHNRHIAGLELSGTVLECDGQRIKMLLDIDSNREDYEKTWFFYAPITNNAMYTMPLKTERVMLQWQSEVDHDALIVRPVRQNYDIPHHSNRHLLTEHNSRMMMIPDLMVYENPVGSIQWLKSRGFNIPTSKGFLLMAGKDISIISNSQIEIRSPERITFGRTNTRSSIDMINNNIHIAADDVVIKSGVNDYKRPRIPVRASIVELPVFIVGRLWGTVAISNTAFSFNNILYTNGNVRYEYINDDIDDEDDEIEDMYWVRWNQLVTSRITIIRDTTMYSAPNFRSQIIGGIQADPSTSIDVEVIRARVVDGTRWYLIENPNPDWQFVWIPMIMRNGIEPREPMNIIEIPNTPTMIAMPPASDPINQLVLIWGGDTPERNRSADNSFLTNARFSDVSQAVNLGGTRTINGLPSVRGLEEGAIVTIYGAGGLNEPTFSPEGSQTWVRVSKWEYGIESVVNYDNMDRVGLAREIFRRHQNAINNTEPQIYLRLLHDSHADRMTHGNNRSPLMNIFDTANGGMARTRSRDYTADRGSYVYLSEYMLRAILLINDEFGTLVINAIAGGRSHTGRLRDEHIRGFAVDFAIRDINPSETAMNRLVHNRINLNNRVQILAYLHEGGFVTQRNQENHREFIIQQKGDNGYPNPWWAPWNYLGGNDHFHLTIWGRLR